MSGWACLSAPLVRAARGRGPQRRSLQVLPRSALLAHAHRHRPRRGASVSQRARRAHPASHPHRPPHPGQPPVSTDGSGGYLSGSNLLACLNALVSRLHHISASGIRNWDFRINPTVNRINSHTTSFPPLLVHERAISTLLRVVTLDFRSFSITRFHYPFGLRTS